MAYKADFSIPERELGRVPIVVTIYKDHRKRRSAAPEKRINEKLGELHLGKGGVDWYPKGVHKNKASKSWVQLARLIGRKDI